MKSIKGLPDRAVCQSILLLVSIVAMLCSCSNPFVKPYGYVSSDAAVVRDDGRPVIMPENAPSITQGFHPDPREDVQDAIHEGIDIYAAPGTPIIAPAPGTVRRSFFEPLYGNRLVIDHGQDKNGHLIRSCYFHLKQRLVQEGERVARGEQIGTLGRTGLLALFPHLHYEVRVATSQGRLKARDPHKYWADGIGVVTCFDKGRKFTDQPFNTTYPLPCRPTE